MHTFGNLADLDSKFINLCKKSINIIEDAAESLGSFYIKNKKIHAGTIGSIGSICLMVQIITTAGGVLFTNNKISKE